VGPYRLLGKIGAGGMGMVYLASSPADDVVALKLVRPELADDEGFRRRFKSEVAAGRRVGGICTAKVRDADPEAERPWVVTDFVAGPNLADLVDRHGPLPADQQRALALGLAEALVAIHGAGVVHRDLKPTNVLCSPSGPKVIDFGIAQAADATLITLTGEVVGSPSWMSPEQVAGGTATASADMFSLGSLLVFAATGRPPFGKGQLEAVLWKIINEPPDLGDDGLLDAELRPLVVRMLEKDSAERPSAQEVLEQLSTQGHDTALSVTQVLNSSWILPAGEITDIHPSSGRRRQADVAAREQASTPAGPQAGVPSTRAAGWYLDPRGNGGLRWWDGIRWTDDVTDAPSVESVLLGPPGSDLLGERADGRPASRKTFGRSLLLRIVIGGLVAISTAAAVWGIEVNTGGNGPRRGRASSTTIGPAASSIAPASNSSLQTITLQPAAGLHDGQVIHIVATGFTPGMPYYSMECKADSYVPDDCNLAEFETVIADRSGTVRLDYRVVKGPFGSHHVICSSAQPCMIGVAGGDGITLERPRPTSTLAEPDVGGQHSDDCIDLARTDREVLILEALNPKRGHLRDPRQRTRPVGGRSQ
jgi:serine/threonine protein kinase